MSNIAQSILSLQLLFSVKSQRLRLVFIEAYHYRKSIYLNLIDMFFCIIGDNHQEIIHAALEYLHPERLTQVKHNIVVFETKYPERLPYCGAIIKRWTITKTQELLTQTQDYSLLGVATKELWSLLKKQLPHIKRYKIIDLIHSDLEVKKEGKEIINIDGQRRWIVQGYQNIDLYETIDFGKPVWGMTVGMMPSKLAHQLINIAIWHHEKHSPLTINNSPLTIWDPFCGFGTTNFLVNHLGYNTIASDLNATSIKQNWKWRLSKSPTHQITKSLILKQDVTQAFAPVFHHADIIVSEGRLGHIITNATRPKEAENSSIAVEKLYKSFLSNLTRFFKNEMSPSGTGGRGDKTLVMTIPVWIKHNHNFSVSDSIAQHARELGRDITLLPEPYSRKWQLVGRQVMIGSFVKTA